MKRIMLMILAVITGTVVCSAAMSNSKVRKETRFLTDKMAYELNLSTEQYNDVYEINYDFIAGIRYLMDDVMRGEEWALHRYYDYLDVRNDDLRWVLSSRQYSRFMQAAHFYRPVYVTGGHWAFRVYVTYTNHNHFYFPRPHHYRTYCGGHCRTHYQNSYYRNRYSHPHYTGSWSVRDDKRYHNNFRSDFGSVNIRPNSNKRPENKKDVYTTTRRSTSNSSRVNRASSSSTPKQEVRTNNTSRRGSVNSSKSDSSPKRNESVKSTRKEKNREASSTTRSSSGSSSRTTVSPSRSSTTRSSSSSRGTSSSRSTSTRTSERTRK